MTSTDHGGTRGLGPTTATGPVDHRVRILTLDTHALRRLY